MATKRTPIGRPPLGRFSSAALDAFRELQKLGEAKCTCTIARKRYGKLCAACRKWSEQRWILHRALGLMPWQRTIDERPSNVVSISAADLRPDPEAQARYRALLAAVEAEAPAKAGGSST